MKLDPIRLVTTTSMLDDKTKKRISNRMKNVEELVSEIEKASGIAYPTYYLEPVLAISVSSDNFGGLGILYARTIPVESKGSIEIIVQLSATLVLYATKSALRLVLAHEFLHYLELVKRFRSGMISSEIPSNSLYEELYDDSRRAIDPLGVFPKRPKLVKDLRANFQTGFSDNKLNEKCRKSWIEKGLPTAKISIGANQVKISMEALARSCFDANVLEFLKKLDSSK